jgi:hypothetical protein
LLCIKKAANTGRRKIYQDAEEEEESEHPEEPDGVSFLVGFEVALFFPYSETYQPPPLSTKVVLEIIRPASPPHTGHLMDSSLSEQDVVHSSKICSQALQRYS